MWTRSEGIVSNDLHQRQLGIIKRIVQFVVRQWLFGNRRYTRHSEAHRTRVTENRQKNKIAGASGYTSEKLGCTGQKQQSTQLRSRFGPKSRRSKTDRFSGRRDTSRATKIAWNGFIATPTSLVSSRSRRQVCAEANLRYFLCGSRKSR